MRWRRDNLEAKKIGPVDFHGSGQVWAFTMRCDDIPYYLYLNAFIGSRWVGFGTGIKRGYMDSTAGAFLHVGWVQDRKGLGTRKERLRYTADLEVIATT
jgi:hypothetical protein